MQPSVSKLLRSMMGRIFKNLLIIRRLWADKPKLALNGKDTLFLVERTTTVAKNVSEKSGTSTIEAKLWEIKISELGGVSGGSIGLGRNFG